MTKKELLEARDARAKEIRNLVDKNTGDAWTDELDKQYKAGLAEIERIDNEVKRIDTVMNLAAQEIHNGMTRDVSARNIEIISEPPVYKNLGTQLMDVAAMANGTASRDAVERLNKVYNAASGTNTTTPSDGGFLVQKDFTTELMAKAISSASLAPKCRRISIGDGSDGLEAPYVDETSRATGSRWGGVRVYRRAEAETVTASKPKFGKWACDLEDMMGICYITGRALRDASSLQSISSMAFEEEFGFTIDDEIFRGSGAGQMLGMLNSGALVTQAKETGQNAQTVVKENIDKMWSRMPARFRAGAEWYINQEVEPQLDSMFLGVGAAGVPVYMPPGGISESPYARLKGRPVIPIEQASALGDVGDIILANMGEYILIDKGGLDAQQSIHVRFLYDEMAFRFIMRINGQPKWKTTLTPYKGSNTLSPFVTLAARA